MVSVKIQVTLYLDSIKDDNILTRNSTRSKVGSSQKGLFFTLLMSVR
jgi:hypothetical protein